MKLIKDFIQNNKQVYLILFFPLYVLAFFILEYFTPTSGYWVTDCILDSFIPFVPEFVFCYVLWFPLFALVGFPLLFRDIDAFTRWMYYLILGFTASMIFYILIPNGQHLRPTGLPADSLAMQILNSLWALDTPTNVFPSMHVVGCIGNICALLDSGSAFRNRFFRHILAISTLLCASSTVLVKQHAIVDIFGAVTLAVPFILIVYGRRILGEKKNRPPILSSRPDRTKGLS